MVVDIGVSFRAAGKLFVQLNLYLELNLGTPSHTTVLNWTKKQGIGNFRDKAYFKEGKWVLIIDESVQFGNKKLLFVAAVPADFKFEKSYVAYNDLIPLVIKVSNSWKSEDIASDIKERIDIENIAYIVSDNGSNLIKTAELLKIPHIEDINHKFSWIMQKIFGNDEIFKSYMKELSDMRAKLSMSKSARIVPPNQRIMSRYMNLEPVFNWGIKMLKLLKTNKLTDEEKDRLSFLYRYEYFVENTYELIIGLNRIQKLMKNSGFNKKNVKKAMRMIARLKDENAKKAIRMIAKYFDDTKLKMSVFKTILCSSDIIESCFGKYKELTKSNKTVGMSDLALCLSAMMGRESQTIKSDFERIKTKDILDWKKGNITETLFAEKMNLLKNIA